MKRTLVETDECGITANRVTLNSFDAVFITSKFETAIVWIISRLCGDSIIDGDLIIEPHECLRTS